MIKIYEVGSLYKVLSPIDSTHTLYLGLAGPSHPQLSACNDECDRRHIFYCFKRAQRMFIPIWRLRLGKDSPRGVVAIKMTPQNKGRN